MFYHDQAAAGGAGWGEGGGFSLDHFYLTLGETRRVVVDVRQADVDHGGSGEAASLSGHVFSLDHHLVAFSLLAVHVSWTQGGPDHT